MTDTKQEILVSIVTVCYNSEATIRDTIESVLHQTYGNIEYIIVDGKSKDHTLDIVEEYRMAFEERGISLQVSSEKDNGVYDAMNKGIAKAKGTLVGMINSDDWYEENTVERVVDTFRKEDFDMFYADIRLYKGDSYIVKRHVTESMRLHGTGTIRQRLCAAPYMISFNMRQTACMTTGI